MDQESGKVRKTPQSTTELKRACEEAFEKFLEALEKGDEEGLEKNPFFGAFKIYYRTKEELEDVEEELKDPFFGAFKILYRPKEELKRDAEKTHKDASLLPIEMPVMQITLESPPQRLSAYYLAGTIVPYLTAIADLQHVIDKVQGNRPGEVGIVSIEQHSPISVSLEGASEAVEVIKESVVPWRRQHTEAMARLAEMEKTAQIETIKAEVLEKRARAQKDRAEAERLTIEADKQKQEVEKLKLENEKLRLELHRAKVQLALDILERIAPDLTEIDRAAYLVKLLPPVEVLASSELEVMTD